MAALKENLTIFLKGLIMGIAGIIPGVSAGTMALILGTYKRIIDSLSRIDFKFIFYLLKGDFKKANKNFKNIDFELFIPLFLGIGLAILVMADVIYFFLQNFIVPTYGFFFGLILASAILLYMKECCFLAKNILFSVIGFLLVFLFIGIAELRLGHSLFIVFFSGIAAVCAMLLPGISGAFVLLLLNQYEYLLGVLRDLRLLEIFIFCLGALIGVLSFSRAINYMLNKYRAPTTYFLIGMMLGALRLPYQEIINLNGQVLPVLISAGFGLLIIFILEKKISKMSKVFYESNF